MMRRIGLSDAVIVALEAIGLDMMSAFKDLLLSVRQPGMKLLIWHY
jgi:hypothetical protein